MINKILNKFGYEITNEETIDPTPVVSRVVFKRPMSAAEKVRNAIRQHEALKALDALPGDESFDSHDFEAMSPHQLMTDEQTGQEMTAGEYVMLQRERELARAHSSSYVEHKLRKESKRTYKLKKIAKPALGEKNDSPEDGEQDGEQDGE